MGISCCIALRIRNSLKKILIISPHFPPSNLAAVHRSRLFAQHLPEYGWEPVVLTVDEKYYEEELDFNLVKLLPEGLRVEKCAAFNVTKPRVVGDIGIRAFYQLYKKAKSIIVKDKIDFLYIPIPSFYAALIGRWLHNTTGVKYGIDYIDPWVHPFPNRDKLFSRHRISEAIANFLEPIAVKNASLITGVAEGYYNGVRERNTHLNNTCLFGAMPYGGEIADHNAVKTMGINPYVFQKNEKIQLVYAGAMLPKAYQPLEAMFKAMSANAALFSNLEIHFIGTGKSPNDPNGFNIKPLAEKYGLWQRVVFEYPKRIPYLDVLVHLESADGIFILGSTEPHYTPSKVYQGVLSGKPILALLHSESSAYKVLKNTGAGTVFPILPDSIDTITNDFCEWYNTYEIFAKKFDAASVDRKVFDAYSASNVTKTLADLLNQIV